MRLPKRVPWASLAELDHICACIYTDEHDIDAKVLAINRISAWKAITALPHALESTLALLVVIVADKNQSSSSSSALSSSTSSSALALRQSYAIAIIRLVNGLVDPLQVGTYARSIHAIAAQLGLPSWLVELRHAATHEELPSLDLLREAGRQSMSWLLYNYFLPTLNPSSSSSSSSSSSHLHPSSSQNPSTTPINSIRPITPTLKAYKSTMKLITRDVSLAREHKPALVALMRDLERWVAEVRVAAGASSMGVIGGVVGGEVEVGVDDDIEDGADPKEVWALERFVDVLAERGMLVPVSKKKRTPSKDGTATLPNKASIAIWEPLLRHVHALHASFPAVLCRRLVSVLLLNILPEQQEKEKEDPTYYTTLTRWVVWAIQTWGGGETKSGASAGGSGVNFLKKDVTAQLMKGLGCSPSSGVTKSVAYNLLKELVAGQEDLEAMTTLFSGQQTPHSKQAWSGEQDLDVMAQRHALLMQTLSSSASEGKLSTKASELESQQQNREHGASPVVLAPGWRIVDSSWKPCPIGVYVR